MPSIFSYTVETKPLHVHLQHKNCFNRQHLHFWNWIFSKIFNLCLNLARDGSYKVEQSTHYPKVVGSNPATTGIRREKISAEKVFLNSVYRPELKWYTHLSLHHLLHCKSCCLNLASDDSSEVEQSTHYPKMVGSNTATTGIGGEKISAEKGFLI